MVKLPLENFNYMKYNTMQQSRSQGGVCMQFSDFITAKEASEKWGVGTRAIIYSIVAGRIPGSFKKGNLWLIPASAEKPEDLRKYNYRRPKKTGP